MVVVGGTGDDDTRSAGAGVQPSHVAVVTPIAEADGCVSPSTPPAAAAPGAQLPACAVCLVRPRDCVLLPCRHVATCGGCTRTMLALAADNAGGRACPVCRTPVIGHFTLFVS
jgi:hypothetical protein